MHKELEKKLEELKQTDLLQRCKNLEQEQKDIWPRFLIKLKDLLAPEKRLVVINAREALCNKSGLKFTTDEELSAVFNSIDTHRENSTNEIYKIDLKRISGELKSYGFGEEQLNKMLLSEKLIIASVFFEAFSRTITDICQSAMDIVIDLNSLHGTISAKLLDNAVANYLKVTTSERDKIEQRFRFFIQEYFKKNELADQNYRAIETELLSIVEEQLRIVKEARRNTNKWLPLAGGLLGAAVGVALIMTGVFAPFGVGLAAIAITGVAAAVVGGSLTAVFEKIYQKFMKRAVVQPPSGGVIEGGIKGSYGGAMAPITDSSVTSVAQSNAVFSDAESAVEEKKLPVTAPHSSSSSVVEEAPAVEQEQKGPSV